MSSTNCYLSCIGISTCLYAPKAANFSDVAPASTTPTAPTRYCCILGVDQARYCCNDLALAAVASGAEYGAPAECSPKLWTPWRYGQQKVYGHFPLWTYFHLGYDILPLRDILLMSIGCGIFFMLLFVSVFCHSIKKWRYWRAQRARDEAETSRPGTDESNRGSIDISSISTFDAGRIPPMLSAHSSRTTVTDVTPPPLSEYTIMPPCYDSLQAFHVDYDKSAPPSYREVIEMSMSTASADLLRSQPTTSFSDVTSGTSSFAVDRTTPMESTTDDLSGSTTATGNQYVIAREQPEIGELNVDDVSVVRVVNRGIESTEGVEVEPHGTRTEDRQPSTTPEIAASTSPSMVYNGEIIPSVSVSVRNRSQSMIPIDTEVNSANRSDSS